MVSFVNENFQFQYSQASTFGNVILIFIQVSGYCKFSHYCCCTEQAEAVSGWAVITEHTIKVLFNLSLLQFFSLWMLITRYNGIYDQYCSSNLSAMLAMIPLSFWSVKKRKKGCSERNVWPDREITTGPGAELSKALQGSCRVLVHSVLWFTRSNWDVHMVL